MRAHTIFSTAGNLVGKILEINTWLQNYQIIDNIKTVQMVTQTGIFPCYTGSRCTFLQSKQCLAVNGSQEGKQKTLPLGCQRAFQIQVLKNSYEIRSSSLEGKLQTILFSCRLPRVLSTFQVFYSTFWLICRQNILHARLGYTIFKSKYICQTTYQKPRTICIPANTETARITSGGFKILLKEVT